MLMPESLQVKQPTLGEALKIHARVGFLSFGGPAAQIALMHKFFVDGKKWLDEKQYLSALSFCMLLPGPEAMQLATYIGWHLHGTIGGLMAGCLFVLPGALLIFLLALLYAYFGNMEWMASAFLGIKASVLVIVIEALKRVLKKALLERIHWIIASLSFLGIFLFECPYPLIIVLATGFGLISTKTKSYYKQAQIHPISIRQTTQTMLVWLAIWLVPLCVIGWTTDEGFLYNLGVFFSKLATVTFGGAYAVLAYMSQEVVFDLGWLSTTQMMDGLGLAETTPGPLILVTEFVGFMAGFKEGGLALATASAMVVLWMIFAPCFLWIFVGAPYIEWITAQPRLRNALLSITAAVVGVMLSLSIWFGLHVLFDEVDKVQTGVMSIWQPKLDSINIIVLILSVLSYYLLVLRHINILYLLGICALISIVTSSLLT